MFSSSLIKDKVVLYIEKYDVAMNCALVILLAYVTAVTVNNFVRSAYAVPGAVSSWHPSSVKATEEARENFRKDLAVIERRNLFQAKVREEIPLAEEVPTQLNLNLCVQGLIVGPIWKFATIRDLTTNQSKVLAEGEELASGWILSSIEPEKIIVSTQRGQLQEAGIDFLRQCAPRGVAPPPTHSSPTKYPENPTVAPPGGEGIQPLSDTEYLIDKKEFEAQFNNLNELMTQARMVPNFTPDREVDGFRIFQIRPGSIFQKLGLRNGDVIERVNGIKLDDPAKGLELFTALKNLSHFTIDLKRNNANMTITYTVK